ncbi:hypothetical protein [Dechloromonas denitrificans]|uniref:hypothetical protein n=1 Tax=Dechloromonas denitrificans TaxID=281362 RepID=UPI001CF96D7A|nr:hypothetical protein [Dechloromonas denitrificans]UCV08469.1 hypothetical protein KI615_02755 [Dechloromonas denitrificans]
MKSKLDLFLICAIALCYTAGQFVAADRFALAAGVLLLVFIGRLLSSAINWVFGGK